MKIHQLRKWMVREEVDCFICPSTDPHSGEYIPSHWQSRAWLTGFDGSAGTAVITLHDAALWTDSRYFIQAEQQLKHSGFQLMKENIGGTPSISEWIVKQGVQRIGLDAKVNTAQFVRQLQYDTQCEIVCMEDDPFEEIWDNRPSIPLNPVMIHPIEYAGEETESKIQKIRKKNGMNRGLLISLLDDVCWTLNLRGSDIDYIPVFVAYLLILPHSVTLYVEDKKLTDEVKNYLQEVNVEVRPYEAIGEDLRKCKVPIAADPRKTNQYCFSNINLVIIGASPVSTLKIIKNSSEIEGYRKAMVRDGVAMVKWMKWVLENVPQGKETEMSLVRKLYDIRKENPLFRGDSFANIIGYEEHGAIVHYEPNAQTDIAVKPEGLLLCDVGSQYVDATTDMTRTIPLGPITAEMKHDYTLVLKGWIDLANAHFPRGTVGTQLDVLARIALWKEGKNYLHGTGHGVGSYLNCHEGPHQIRMNHLPQPLYPNMIVTNEPGLYREGLYGIRHENMMLVVEDKEGECFGPYYRFEQLTMAPVFTSAIDWEMLTKEQTRWIQEYNLHVFQMLQSYLDEDEKTWYKTMFLGQI